MNKRIAYITDIHLDEQFLIDQGVRAWDNLEKILQSLVSRKIDEIVIGGDIGEASAYAHFFALMIKQGLPFHITPGNHDDPLALATHYTHHPLTENKLYGFHEDAVHKYIFMDSSAEEVNTTQLQWLEQQLNTDKKIILFIHHPVLPVNTIIDHMYPLKGREKVSALLRAVNKDIVIFCGHYHMQDEQVNGKLKQYITPAAAYQIIKEAAILEVDHDNFGYRVIEFSDGKVDSEIIWLSTN